MRTRGPAHTHGNGNLDCYDADTVNFLAFLPILSLMMFVHELGHFVTARLAGITVQEFGFGLPPRLWGFKRGGVIYSINWIPFGAFVKMLGEEDPSAPGSFASKPRAIRAIVLAAGSGMNFLLAVAAFAMVFIVGIPGITPDSPVNVAEVAPAGRGHRIRLGPGGGAAPTCRSARPDLRPHAWRNAGGDGDRDELRHHEYARCVEFNRGHPLPLRDRRA